MGDDYAACYRWDWFRREDWRGSFRQRKRHSSGAFIELARERGLGGRCVLDCSCGLGLKTIVMKEAGLNVEGSDRCAAAIDHARQLAAQEGHAGLRYFVSSWADLGQKVPARYAAVFNDALSWVHDDEEMAASLRGLHDCLRPGGLLAYMGALPGTDTDQSEILRQEWESKTAGGRWRLGFYASDETASVQEVVGYERGADFIDQHHLLVVEENGERRLEAWSIRCAVKWSWPRMEVLLRRAGFTSFGTKAFVPASGRPHHLVVAERA